MDFQALFCAKCRQARDGSKMCYFRECSHFFCLPCLGYQTSCLKCGFGTAISCKNEEPALLMLSLVYDISLRLKETFRRQSEDGLRIIEEPAPKSTAKESMVKNGDNSSQKETLSNEVEDPVCGNRKGKRRMTCDKSDCDDVERKIKKQDNATVSTPVLRRTMRTIKSLKTSNDETVPLVRPIKKRRKSEVTETPVASFKMKTSNKKGAAGISPKENKINEDVKHHAKLKAIKKPLRRMNEMGETALHVAVNKKNLELVEDLLKTHDPNVKDFAGWSPLHDAVAKGIEPIVACLLKHGALANIPGYGNSTALHIAVEKMNKPLIALLMNNGGNPHAKNNYGSTPLSTAGLLADEEIISLLSASVNPCRELLATSIAIYNPVSVFTGLLPKDAQTAVLKFAKQFRIKIESDIYKADCVVISNSVPAIDWPLARIMAKGSYVCSKDWCAESLATGQLQNINGFLVNPEWLPGLLSAQENNRQQRPGLFDGFEIKLGSSPKMLETVYKCNDMVINLHDLTQFMRSAGGKLINRMPDPENPLFSKVLPYHAKPGTMEHCPQIVIYFPTLWEPALKFNMTHLKTLPIQWLMDCITSFEIKSDTQKYFM